MDTYGESQRRAADHLQKAADTLAGGESGDAADARSLTRMPRRTDLAADD